MRIITKAINNIPHPIAGCPALEPYLLKREPTIIKSTPTKIKIIW
jgi:hypothetical protein